MAYFKASNLCDKSLKIKILVTAEILLIWTNALRTNVAWTNVAVTVVICCICSQDPLFKV